MQSIIDSNLILNSFIRIRKIAIYINWRLKSYIFRVAPRVGAWIETCPLCPDTNSRHEVAPRVGAWIETPPQPYISWKTRRAPRGRVD